MSILHAIYAHLRMNIRKPSKQVVSCFDSICDFGPCNFS